MNFFGGLGALRGMSFGSGLTISMPGMSMTGCNTMSPMTLRAGDHMMVAGERIEGPCTVEVRQGRLLVGGRPHKASEGKALQVSIHADTAGDLKIDHGEVHIDGDAAAVQTVSGAVTVRGDVKGTVTSGGVQRRQRPHAKRSSPLVVEEVD